MTTDAEQPNTAQPTPDNDTNRTAGETQDAVVTMTQAQIDAIVQNRLAEERRRLQTKYGDLDELVQAKSKLDEIKTAEMTELEKLQKRLADAESEKQQLAQQAEQQRIATLKLKIGHELGIPSALAERLSGSDEDAIKADAELLRGFVAQPGVTVPNINATEGGGQGQNKSTTKLTPGQRAAADKAGISYDTYADLLEENGRVRSGT